MKFRTPISERKFHSLAQKQIAGGPRAEEQHWIFGNICKSTAFSSASCCSAVSFLSLWRSSPCQCLGFTPKGTLWLVRRTVGVADMVQGWCWPVVVSHAAGSAFFCTGSTASMGHFHWELPPRHLVQLSLPGITVLVTTNCFSVARTFSFFLSVLDLGAECFLVYQTLLDGIVAVGEASAIPSHGGFSFIELQLEQGPPLLGIFILVLFNFAAVLSTLVPGDVLLVWLWSLSIFTCHLATWERALSQFILSLH